MKDSIKISYIILFVLSVQCQETFLGHLFAGYQGWFTTPSDGSGLGWDHYKVRHDQPFSRTNTVIDFWPQMSQYEKQYPVGQLGSSLFSAYDLSTVRTHFKWMSQYDISGIFVQRFANDIKSPGSPVWKAKNKLIQNVMTASRQVIKFWGLMYDLTGLNPGQIRSVVMNDINYLRSTYNFHASPANYIYHKGKPLITFYGMGFVDNRHYSLNQCKELVDFAKGLGFSIMIGTPRYWREGGRDTVTGADLNLLHNIIKESDVVLPWTVGRYQTVDQARIDARVNVKADVAWCNQNHVTLMPVIFPGFSWHNLQASIENPDHPGPYDQIPRKQNGVVFLQDQGVQVIKAGARNIYVAMFDEMNEGTAIFKCSRNPPSLPDGLRFVPYTEDPGFYLQVAGNLNKSLR